MENEAEEKETERQNLLIFAFSEVHRYQRTYRVLKQTDLQINTFLSGQSVFSSSLTHTCVQPPICRTHGETLRLEKQLAH